MDKYFFYIISHYIINYCYHFLFFHDNTYYEFLTHIFVVQMSNTYFDSSRRRDWNLQPRRTGFQDTGQSSQLGGGGPFREAGDVSQGDGGTRQAVPEGGSSVQAS